MCIPGLGLYIPSISMKFVCSLNLSYVFLALVLRSVFISEAVPLSSLLVPFVSEILISTFVLCTISATSDTVISTLYDISCQPVRHAA